MDESDVLAFLKKLVIDYEENKLSEDQKKCVSEFFMEFKFTSEKKDKSEKELMNYLFLGWFIQNCVKK